jgi:hypothetical protein
MLIIAAQNVVAEMLAVKGFTDAKRC